MYKKIDNSEKPVQTYKLIMKSLSITDEQRKEFRNWSEALDKLDITTKETEAVAWIASAFAILGKTNVIAKETSK